MHTGPTLARPKNLRHFRLIIVKLTSGLGNQLFQYAAGLSLARLRNSELRLDLDWFGSPAAREKHEVFGLDRYSASLQRAGRLDLCRVRGLGRSPYGRAEAALLRLALRVRGQIPGGAPMLRIGDGDFSFDQSFYTRPDFIYLDGNWQSEKFFAPVAEEIRSLILGYQPSDASVLSIAREIDDTPSAFIHVRRGDYVANDHFKREIGPVGTSYYHAAIAALQAHAGPCRLFVFTNDPDWAHTHLPSEARIIGPADVDAPHDVLFLMSRCRHAIMANSSLSWWAAWLNQPEGKFVSAPKPWFANSWRNTRDLLPPAWLQLDR